MQAVADQTYRVFPDWRQQIERIRGGDDWAVFEWSGSGTYRGPGAEDGPGFPVRIEGATIVEVNDDGLITAWRDFPDVYASMQQITAGLLAVGGRRHKKMRSSKTGTRISAKTPRLAVETRRCQTRQIAQ